MKSIYIIAIMVFSCQLLSAQESFLKVEVPETPETSIDVPYQGILELKDGGLVYAITEDNFEYENQWTTRVKIIKLDSQGNMVWVKGFIYDTFNKVSPFFESEGGDIYVFGNEGTESVSIVIKLSGSGELIWSKKYWLNYNSGNSTTALGATENNIIFSGSVIYGIHEKVAIWSINQHGEVLWALLSDNAVPGKDEYMGIWQMKQNSKGNVVVAVHGYSKKKSKHFVGLSEVDKNGKVQWYRNYLHPADLWTSSLNNTKNGYVFTSNTGYNGWRIIVNTDKSGKIRWKHHYQYPDGLFYIQDIFPIESESGGYFALGGTYTELFSIKLDSIGGILKVNKMKSLFGAINLSKMSKTQDGGYVNSGFFWEYKPDTVNHDWPFLLKLNKDFEFPCNSEAVDVSEFTMKDIVLEEDSTEYVFKPATTTGVDFVLDTISVTAALETICETTATTTVSNEASGIMVYPNPVSAVLNISIDTEAFSAGRRNEIDITDILGRQLYTIKPDIDGRASFDTQVLPPGMYTAVWSSSGHQMGVVKFIVVR